MVDTLGLMVGITGFSAAVQDRDGAAGLLRQTRRAAGFLCFGDKILAMDAAHDGIATLHSALEQAHARAAAAEAEAARAGYRYRREPVTTKSASRAPQFEQTSRAAQSITVIVMP